MASRIPSRALFSLFLLVGVCAAQRYTPPPPPLTVDPCAVHPNPNIPVASDPKAKPPNCPPPDAKPAAPASSAPSGADAFPFPGDAPSPQTAKPSTANQFPFPGDATPNAPAAKPAAPAAKPGSTADQFPYPGETPQSPDAVPEGNTPRYVPDSPTGNAPTPAPGAADDNSSGSSSSSSGDSLPIPTDDDKPAADTPTAKGRRALPKVPAQSPDERVTEDLKVAKFYSGRGNYEAAYMRSKDAIKWMPNDPESHLRLAQAAQQLKKNDEAIAEYKAYLKLDPGGDWTKDAEQGLSELK